MSFWLLAASAFFAGLAVDAWRMRSSSKDAPYEIEAKARGEPLEGVPLHEQLRRKVWNFRYGMGEPSEIVWVWLILAVGFLGAAIAKAMT